MRLCDNNKELTFSVRFFWDAPFCFLEGIMEKIIYCGVFDTKDKSYDEKTVISAEAFVDVKKVLNYTSGACLKLIKLCVGVAVYVGASLRVGEDRDGEATAEITADSFCFDPYSVILLENICALTKSVKIESKNGKCTVSVGI